MKIRLETFSTSAYHYVNAYSDSVRVGKLGIEDKGNHKVHINYVSTDIKHTGKGIATMMLNKAIEMFKGYEISLMVKPMPRTGENIKYRTTKGLVEFYKKFGFVRTDDPCLVTMILKN
jgi:ribosomal protein S18 acetylase RimI-like enzyme